MPPASPLHDRGPVVSKVQALADRLTTAIAVGAYSPAPASLREGPRRADGGVPRHRARGHPPRCRARTPGLPCAGATAAPSSPRPTGRRSRPTPRVAPSSPSSRHCGSSASTAAWSRPRSLAPRPSAAPNPTRPTPRAAHRVRLRGRLLRRPVRRRPAAPGDRRRRAQRATLRAQRGAVPGGHARLRLRALPRRVPQHRPTRAPRAGRGRHRVRHGARVRRGAPALRTDAGDPGSGLSKARAGRPDLPRSVCGD